MMHSAMHYGNLQSLFDITFSLSNYTLSFNLIKRIGFWDTCADAIGEDYHTVEKCYWKTDGDIICVPIFAMFNQLNISTGKGYCADMKARFWQAERHAQGIADVAYNLRMLMNKPLRLRTLILAYETIEIFILPAIVPWMVFSMNFQQQIMFIFSKPPA